MAVTRRTPLPIPDFDDPALRDFALRVKMNFEYLSGDSTTKIDKLSSDATLSDVIAKVNEIISRIQE